MIDMGVCLQLDSTYIVVGFACCSFGVVRFYSIGTTFEVLATVAEK